MQGIVLCSDWSADGSGQDPGSRQKHKFETDWFDNQTDHKCQPAKNGQGNRMNMSHSEEHVFRHSSYSFPPLRGSSLTARGLLRRTVASCPEPSTHFLLYSDISLLVRAMLGKSHQATVPLLWIPGCMEDAVDCHLPTGVLVKDGVRKSPQQRPTVLLVDFRVEFGHTTNCLDTGVHTAEKLFPQTRATIFVPTI